jgi:hypothetical protein
MKKNLANSLQAALVLAALIVSSSIGYCQTTAGSLAGDVVDAQHAAITGAVVTATEQEQKVQWTAKTDNLGHFVFPQVPPGTYTVVIKSKGFQTVERHDVIIHGNDNLSIGRLVMPLGEVSQIVEVTATAAPMQLESAERSDSLVNEQIQDIAVNSRSYLDLVKLIPGVVSTVNLQTAGTGGLGSISVNGSRANQNQLTINGIGDVDTGSNGTQNVTLSLDSVQEFKILTSSYQAQYGRSSGAQISVVTKSGTSQFHGSGAWYHRHEGLNANNWLNNLRGVPRPLFRFNDADYTIGGPVYIPNSKILEKKDKLFFFWSQEFQEQLRPQGLRRITVPTALERQGDFSQSVDSNGRPFPFIKDPLLVGQSCKSTNTAGCFKDGGVLGRIPQNRLYAPGIALLKLYPLPNVTGQNGFNFQSQISDQYPRREDLLRLDYNFSSKSRFWMHRIVNSNTFTSEYGSFVLGPNVPITPISVANPGYGYAFGNTYIFSPTLINEITFGWTSNSFLIEPTTNAYTRTASGIHLPVLFPSAVQLDLIPNTTFGGSRIANSPSIGGSSCAACGPFRNYNTTIDLTDNLSKVLSRHTLKTGVYIHRSRKNQSAFADNNGNYNFGDNGNNSLDTGFGFANAAVGVFNSFDQASAYVLPAYRYWNMEGYVQDTWKINGQMTLDYGMRIAWYQPQYDSSLEGSTFVPSLFNPASSPQLLPNGRIVPGTGNLLNGIIQAGHGASKYLTTNRGAQWGPRLGFAWDIAGMQKLVFHAATGIYYDRTQGNNTAFFQIQNPPANSVPTLTNDYATSLSSSTNVILSPSGLQALAPQGKIPTTYQFTSGLQASLPFRMVLETAYVGSISNHQANQLNLNAIPYGATFLPQNQDPAHAPCTVPGCAAKNVNLLRPYPGFGDIILHANNATSNYNALQVSVNRRTTRGLFLGGSYTWSRNLGTASNDGGFFRIDGLDRFANYGPVGQDRRHNFTLNYVYEMPGLPSNNFLLRALTHGWQTSGFVHMESGSPFTPSFSITGESNQNLTGSYTEPARVSVIGNPLTGSDNPFNRLNALAFAPPVTGGSRGLESTPNYLYNPWMNNWDMSVQKSFSFEKGVTLRLRADAFNVLNHTQFSGINSSLSFNQAGQVQNLAYDANGNLVRQNGFGTVNGARDPRILQLSVRVNF